MELASHQSQSPSPRPIDGPRGVGVIDTIEMKRSLGITHAPGVVAVLDAFPSADPQSFIGRGVRISTPAGRERTARVEGVRDHGTTISVFFGGLTRADLPVGSRIEFDD